MEGLTSSTWFSSHLEEYDRLHELLLVVPDWRRNPLRRMYLTSLANEGEPLDAFVNMLKSLCP